MKTYIHIQYLVGESVNAVTYWTETEVSVQRSGPAVHLIFPNGDGQSPGGGGVKFTSFANAPHVTRWEQA